MFKVGDTVEWSSQSGGYTEDKRGVVAAVVPVGAVPTVISSGGFTGAPAPDIPATTFRMSF